MTSKPKASLREGIVLGWRENASKRWIDVHIDKTFWNIQTPPKLKKTSTICRAGRDFMALRF
ncbi:hypothetical protein EV363DRAFT_1158657 [Boletus edulis]|nr:hypothetical protein EV363DRAFT_1158657 [Boletus edulis]